MDLSPFIQARMLSVIASATYSQVLVQLEIGGQQPALHGLHELHVPEHVALGLLLDLLNDGSRVLA